MDKKFVIDDIEYVIVEHPTLKNYPMVARTDNLPINRKGVCRIFLKEKGLWKDEYQQRVTNDLERYVSNYLEGKAISGERKKKASTPKVQKERKKYKKVARRDDVPTITEDVVKDYLLAWDKLEDYVAQENAINDVFKKYKSNNNLQNILIKCSLLNDFYSTNIFKVFPVAKHILSLNIDKRFKDKEDRLELVNEIAKIKLGKDDDEKNFYSFASKYCSHHHEDIFPIYDYYVQEVLKYFRGVDDFYNFSTDELRDYPTFVTVLIKFREHYKLEKYSLKELDKCLWQFGKKYFPKSY